MARASKFRLQFEIITFPCVIHSRSTTPSISTNVVYEKVNIDVAHLLSIYIWVEYSTIFEISRIQFLVNIFLPPK